MSKKVVSKYQPWYIWKEFNKINFSEVALDFIELHREDLCIHLHRISTIDLDLDDDLDFQKLLQSSNIVKYHGPQSTALSKYIAMNLPNLWLSLYKNKFRIFYSSYCKKIKK